MTGFGQASATAGDCNLQVEVKALNSKFLDLSLRLPKLFSEKELEVRNLITDKLERGKVTVSIDMARAAATLPSSRFNEESFLIRYAELKKLADKVMASHDGIFELALRSPDVEQEGDKEELTPELSDILIKTLAEAIEKCDNFRKTEGATLSGKFKTYINSIAQLLIKVEKLDPIRIEKIRKRISKGISDFFGEEGFDANRLEQEIIFYIEKLDIHEERVRLKTHLDYFLQVMSESSNGKKLGFIAQEIGREINTIGSKANDAEIQREVVIMKEELEKIKEQLNNII